MAIFEAIIGPVSKLLDKIIPDPQARDRAKLELMKLQGDQEMATIAVADAGDRRRGAVDRSLDQPRPAELPLHDVRADPLVDPDGPDRRRRPAHGDGIANGMTAYLRGIPEELYALFGTGYLGYTAARTWGKVKGVGTLGGASAAADGMKPDRLSAFTDGVVAIIITIMVLELPVPAGADGLAGLQAGCRRARRLCSRRFVNVGIFWNNHHHHAAVGAAGRRAGPRGRICRFVLPLAGAVRDPLGRRGGRSTRWPAASRMALVLLCASPLPTDSGATHLRRPRARSQRLREATRRCAEGTVVTVSPMSLWCALAFVDRRRSIVDLCRESSSTWSVVPDSAARQRGEALRSRLALACSLRPRFPHPASNRSGSALESWHGTTIIGVQEGRQHRHRRRRPGLHGQHGDEAQRAQGPPARRGRQGHRRVRRRDRRRLHPVRAAREEARAVSAASCCAPRSSSPRTGGPTNTCATSRR